MSERSVAFVRSLAERFHGLTPVLNEHLQDNFGEILPHLFFWDLTRHAVSLASPATPTGGTGGDDELRGILQALEDAYSGGDEELQELIAVSFLENLPGAGEPGSVVREMLGPHLSAQLAIMDAWTPNIASGETEIRGQWSMVGGRIEADGNCRRIDDLIRRHLHERARDSSGWNRLFVDPDDGRYWELTYPESGSHGGGPPCLSNLSESEARARYHVQQSDPERAGG